MVAYASLNKKALDPVILDLRERSEFTDFFVIVSGRTEIQVRTITQEVERVCREERIPILHSEGGQVNSWVLLDLGDVVVHVFREAERHFYDLEGLWHRARRVTLPPL